MAKINSEMTEVGLESDVRVLEEYEAILSECE